VVRVDTNSVADFSAGSAEFVIIQGIVNLFDPSKFQIEDVSSNPLPGDWSIGLTSSGSGSGISLFYTAADPYLAWIESFGYNGSDTEMGEDPDLDGLSNGIEFVVGSSPADSNDAETPSLSVVEDMGVEYHRFAFRRTSRSQYLSILGEVSPNLVNWDDITTATGFDSVSFEPIDADTDLVELFLLYDTEAFPQRFFRLFVDLPE